MRVAKKMEKIINRTNADIDKTTGRFLKGMIPWNKGLKGWHKVQPKNLFKKGNLPKQTRPEGSERINKDGFTEVKIDYRNKWRLKHHLVYEDYYGEKVGRWDKVIFLDGNRQNFNPKNLVKLSTGEQVCLAKGKMLSDDVELNKAAVNFARLVVSAASKKEIKKRF